MAWDNADTIFPLGYTTLPDGSIISNEDLKKSEIKTLYSFSDGLARDMVTKKLRYVWGDNGEFIVLNDYNVYDQTYHVHPDYLPLSVYGQSMLNSYLSLHVDTEDT